MKVRARDERPITYREALERLGSPSGRTSHLTNMRRLTHGRDAKGAKEEYEKLRKEIISSENDPKIRKRELDHLCQEVKHMAKKEILERIATGNKQDIDYAFDLKKEFHVPGRSLRSRTKIIIGKLIAEGDYEGAKYLKEKVGFQNAAIKKQARFGFKRLIELRGLGHANQIYPSFGITQSEYVSIMIQGMKVVIAEGRLEYLNLCVNYMKDYLGVSTSRFEVLFKPILRQVERRIGEGHMRKDNIDVAHYSVTLVGIPWEIALPYAERGLRRLLRTNPVENRSDGARAAVLFDIPRSVLEEIARPLSA